MWDTAAVVVRQRKSEIKERKTTHENLISLSFLWHLLSATNSERKHEVEKEEKGMNGRAQEEDGVFPVCVFL